MAAFAAILITTIFGSWSWGLRLTESRQNENAVKELQTQIELKNVERRDLLADLINKDLKSVQLQEEDLLFFETQIFESSTIEEQQYCLEVLLFNNFFQPNRYTEKDPRKLFLKELLNDWLSTNTESELDDRIRSAIGTLEKTAATQETKDEESKLSSPTNNGGAN